jgi:phosphoglycolate phosphatase-like HAD superfamily hydrolase
LKQYYKKLKERNIKLGISSGVKETYLKEHLGQLLNYFDAITSRDECEEEKPSPKPILNTLLKLNQKPENAAYVGDMEEDIIAGRKAGVYTIVVNREGVYKPIEKLILLNPDYIINNLMQLLSIICLTKL